VRLPEVARSTTFHWALVVAGAFAVCTLFLFGFVYWQTAAYITANFDGVIADAARAIVDEAPGRRLAAIDEHLAQDPRRVKLAGLFAWDRQRIAGNLEALPPELEPNGVPRGAAVVRIDNRSREEQFVRVMARRLPDGDVLVVGRNIDELGELRTTIERALALGVVPALCLAVLAGAILSDRARRRIDRVGGAVQRIMAGDLQERLPTRGIDDPFDKLASIVNRMLDRIESLLHEIAGTGDDIAHDLRTPLTRVRASLERGRDNAATLGELQAVVDRAIGGLDQTLTIITALLRIAEIEQGRRFAGFGEVDLAGIVREVGELYEPIAEDKQLELRIEAAAGPPICGDRDLLFEAIANLVDNAVKFTPEGGRVLLAVTAGAGGSVVRICDTGPGIADGERQAVVKRFYRSDKSRRTPGTGLGLSLVAAIAKLHGFRLSIGGGPGCVVELACWRHAEA
jgi:signal transduction histidine kinase